VTLNETGSSRAMAGSETGRGGEGRPSTGPQATTTARTVLVVDDDRGIVRLIEAMLRLGGYTVLSADSGKVALKAAHNSLAPIDLLLTDMVMPDLSGTELADELRKLRPDLRVIFMNGDAERTPADTLRKPFTLQCLLGAVKAALGRES
jgi:two-component system cell cycle sensor histidine kinase/response regulator CckA